MSETERTFEEVVDNLNGWEELAIEKATGISMATLLQEHPLQALRAMIAMDRSRDSLTKYPIEYKTAMEMKLGKVNDYFADNADDVMPDDPDSESGKDDSPDDSEPTTWPHSVSQPA